MSIEYITAYKTIYESRVTSRLQTRYGAIPSSEDKGTGNMQFNSVD